MRRLWITLALLALLALLTLLSAGCTKSASAPGASTADPAGAEAQPGTEQPTAAPTAPAPTEPAGTAPAETEPVETEPVETEPVETEPAETEPIETEPIETEPIETEPPLPALTGFAKVPMDLEAFTYTAAMAATETEAGFLLCQWVDDVGLPVLTFGSADPYTAECTGLVSLEPGLAGVPDTLEFDGERIVVIDTYMEQAAVYDRSGALLELRDYPVMDEENRGWQNRMVDSGFTRWNDYASLRPYGGDACYFGFYDDAELLYSVEAAYDSVQAVNDRTLLLTSSLPGEKGVGCRLLDLREGLLLGEAELTGPEDREYLYFSAGGAAIGRGWVLLSMTLVEDWDFAKPQFWFWYPDPEAAEPFPVQTLTEKELDRKTQTLVNDLETRYPLCIYLDQEPDPDLVPIMGLEDELEYDPNFRNRCLLGASQLQEYAILRQLEAFLQKLPEGFVPELCIDVPDMENWGSGQIHVFIVRNIPGDTAAFANAWNYEMTVCFATEEFAESHLAHEFTHLMDLRLTYYCYSVERSLEGEWWELTPERLYDPDYDDYDQIDRYYVSSYARTNSMEDRAETFQMLFDCEIPLEEAWWYAGRDGVQAKVDYLIEIIREAFPSVQATDRAWWEKRPQDAALAPAA